MTEAPEIRACQSEASRGSCLKLGPEAMRCSTVLYHRWYIHCLSDEAWEWYSSRAKCAAVPDGSNGARVPYKLLAAALTAPVGTGVYVSSTNVKLLTRRNLSWGVFNRLVQAENWRSMKYRWCLRAKSELSPQQNEIKSLIANTFSMWNNWN
jgi:hypothetical protein